MNKLETILHPVRFKMIQSFLGEEKKTAKELAKELKEIPQATLYRQLETLVKANILEIVEEHQIRGTIERVYRLNLPSVILTNEDVKNFSKEDHLHYFTFFTLQLAKDFEAYLQQKDIDFERDGVGYRQSAFYLSDEEFRQFLTEMTAVFKKYKSFEPKKGRTKRLLTTIVFPGERNDERE